MPAMSEPIHPDRTHRPLCQGRRQPRRLSPPVPRRPGPAGAPSMIPERRRAEAGAGRTEGPADEAGPDPGQHPGCRAARIREAAERIAGQRPADGRGLRPPPHGRASSAPDWRQKFVDFSPEAVAAASLGQVHKASLPSGETVAVKLQYPDMASAVEADLGQLDLMLSLFRRVDGSINTGRDPRRARRPPARGAGLWPRAEAPAALSPDAGGRAACARAEARRRALSTSRLLTMEWLEGTPPARLEGCPGGGPQPDRGGAVPGLVSSLLPRRA